MRINFFAGPGAGKSTTAAWLFSELKRRGYSIELISEYVKSWVYLNRMPKAFDQVYLFGKQMHFEDKVLSSGVQNIITDSPIFLSHIYAGMFSGIDGLSESLWKLAKLYDEAHPSVSIYLQRNDKEFRTEGRWGNLEGAKKVDEQVWDFISDYHSDAPERLLVSNWKPASSHLGFRGVFLRQEVICHTTPDIRKSRVSQTFLKTVTTRSSKNILTAATMVGVTAILARRSAI